MGKKRRLNSAKLKFNAKHSSHPRARLLAQEAQQTAEHTPAEETTIPTPPLEVEKVAPEPTLTLKTVETTKTIRPKITKAKKTASTSKKRTTKKKTTAPSA